jgi:predicted nucleic acid-binding protein
MGKPIIVDTDVMIDYLRGRNQAIALIREYADRIVLSPIVVAELYAGVKGAGEEEILDELVSLFRVIEVTSEVARAGGLFKRDYGRSHGVSLADAIIAATVQSEIAELCTLNVKHYPMMKGLKAAYLKTE